LGHLPFCYSFIQETTFERENVLQFSVARIKHKHFIYSTRLLSRKRHVNKRDIHTHIHTYVHTHIHDYLRSYVENPISKTKSSKRRTSCSFVSHLLSQSINDFLIFRNKDCYIYFLSWPWIL